MDIKVPILKKRKVDLNVGLIGIKNMKIMMKIGAIAIPFSSKLVTPTHLLLICS